MRIEILDEAEQDLINGFSFYQRQQQGLGHYFLDSLFSDLESLKVYAGAHPIHYGFHRLLAKRFPFAVYYMVEGDLVRVYPILDCRRDPAWIRDRLE